MRLLTALVLLLLCSIGTKAQFHVRVKPWFGMEDSVVFGYTIQFTNDDWQSREEINAWEMVQGVGISEWPLWFRVDQKKEAIDMAKTITSYEIARGINQGVWNKVHYIPKAERDRRKRDCEPIDIY